MAHSVRATAVPEPEAPWERYRTAPEQDRTWTWFAVLAGLPVPLFVVALPFQGFSVAWVPWLGFTAVYLLALLGLLMGGSSARPLAGDAVTVTSAGIQPTLAEPAIVPAAHVAAFEIRRWHSERPGENNDHGSVNLSLRLADGRFVILPALARSPLREKSVRVMISTSDAPDWAPLRGAAGGPLLWRHITDADVAARLTTRFDALLDRSAAPTPAEASALVLHTAEGRTGTRHRSGAAGRMARRSWPLLPPTHHVDVPRAATAPRAKADLPTWDDFTVPARYWSAVSLTAPGPAGRRAEVRFEADGVVLVGAMRRRPLPYEEIDAFAVAQRDSGVWALGLRTTDGRVHDLPGLVRGAGNTLCWRAAPRERSGGAADGTLPWGPDDDDLVAARLNAHLAWVRDGGAR